MMAKKSSRGSEKSLGEFFYRKEVKKSNDEFVDEDRPVFTHNDKSPLKKRKKGIVHTSGDANDKKHGLDSSEFYDDGFFV